MSLEILLTNIETHPSYPVTVLPSARSLLCADGMVIVLVELYNPSEILAEQVLLSAAIRDELTDLIAVKQRTIARLLPQERRPLSLVVQPGIPGAFSVLLSLTCAVPSAQE